MLKIERSVTDFALCFPGAVHIHALDPDRGQDPDLARSTSPHLAALDLAPAQHLRKGKLYQPNHHHNLPKNLVPDRKVKILSSS